MAHTPHALSARFWRTKFRQRRHRLFPGGHPGRHLATENIRSELVRNGIQPKAARNAAMFGLAATMPTPILAEILGLAPNTATRWAALASRDWSLYTAQVDQHGCRSVDDLKPHVG
jgi:hypothetical protein